MSKTIYGVGPVLYAILNVSTMYSAASGSLGSGTMDAILLFLVASFCGLIGTCLLPAFGVPWSGAFAVVCLFGVLFAFNFWCLMAASAAC